MCLWNPPTTGGSTTESYWRILQVLRGKRYCGCTVTVTRRYRGCVYIILAWLSIWFAFIFVLLPGTGVPFASVSL